MSNPFRPSSPLRPKTNTLLNWALSAAITIGTAACVVDSRPNEQVDRDYSNLGVGADVFGTVRDAQTGALIPAVTITVRKPNGFTSTIHVHSGDYATIYDANASLPYAFTAVASGYLPQEKSLLVAQDGAAYALDFVLEPECATDVAIVAPSSSGSCVDSCGGNAGDCWCDAWCFAYGDCCADVCESCGEHDAACDCTDEPDDMGLALDAFDGYSWNEQATLLAAPTNGVGLIDMASDQYDQYRVAVVAGQTVSISFTPPSGASAIDMPIYGSNGALLTRLSDVTVPASYDASAISDGFIYFTVDADELADSGEYALVVTVN